MKHIKVEFSDERIIPAGGLAVVGAILLTYIGMLCMGKPAFDSVHEFDDDPEFYRYALGITRSIPSEETLRQRMDSIGSSLRKQVLAENVELCEGKQHCQRNTPEFLRETLELCRQFTKEPLLVRLDSGNDAAENIGILLETGRYFIIKRNLRRESQEDWYNMAKEYSQNVAAPQEGKTVYIGSDWKTVSWKAGDGTTKNATIRTGYEVIERTIDKYGQFLLPADIEVNTWWANTGMSDDEIIEYYHAHGECEQFHSEIKSDMDVERLPSGKFATNESHT